MEQPSLAVSRWRVARAISTATLALTFNAPNTAQSVQLQLMQRWGVTRSAIRQMITPRPERDVFAPSQL